MRTDTSDEIQGTKKKKLYGSTVGERKQRRRDQRAQTTSKALVSGTKSEMPLGTRKFSSDLHHRTNLLNQESHFDDEIEDTEDEIALHPWRERMKPSSTRDPFESSISYESDAEESVPSHSISKSSFESKHETENREKTKGYQPSMGLWQSRRPRAEKANDILLESPQNENVMKRCSSQVLNMSDASSMSDNIVWNQISRKKALHGADYDYSESFDPYDDGNDIKPPKMRKQNTSRSLTTGTTRVNKKSRRENESKVKVQQGERDSLDFYTQADESIASQSDCIMSPSQSSCTSSESSVYQASQDATFLSKKRKVLPLRSANKKLVDTSTTKKSRKWSDLTQKKDILIKDQEPKKLICDDSADISAEQKEKSGSKSRPNNVEPEIDAAFQSFKKASNLFACITVTSSMEDIQNAVETLTMAYLGLKANPTAGSPHCMDKDIAKLSRENLKHCFMIMEKHRSEMLQLLFTILYHHFQVVSFSHLYDSGAKGLVSPSVSIFLSDHVIIYKLIEVLIKVTTSSDEQNYNSLVRDGVSVAILFSLHMVKKGTILEIADASVLTNQSLLEGIKYLIESIPYMYSYCLMEASLLFIAKLRYQVLLSLSHVSRQSIRKQRIEFAKRLSTSASGGCLDLIEHTDPNLPKNIQGDLYDGVSVISHKTFEEWSRDVIHSKSRTVTSFHCNGIYSPFDNNLGTAIARSAMVHVNANSLSFFVPTHTSSSEKISEFDVFPKDQALVDIPFSYSQDDFVGILNKKERALTLHVDRTKADGLDLILPDMDSQEKNRICVKIYVRHSEYFLFEGQVLERHGKLVHEDCRDESSLSDGASILTRVSKRTLSTKLDGRPEIHKKMHECLNHHESTSSDKAKAVDCRKEKTVSTPSRKERNGDSIKNSNHLNETQYVNQKSIQEVTPLPLVDHDLKRRRLQFASNRSPIDIIVSLRRVLSSKATSDCKELKDALEDPNMIDVAECIIDVDEKLLSVARDIEAVAHDLKHIANLTSKYRNESFTKGLDHFYSVKDAFDKFASFLDDEKKAVEHDFANLMWQKMSSSE